MPFCNDLTVAGKDSNKDLHNTMRGIAKIFDKYDKYDKYDSFVLEIYLNHTY